VRILGDYCFGFDYVFDRPLSLPILHVFSRAWNFAMFLFFYPCAIKRESQLQVLTHPPPTIKMTKQSYLRSDLNLPFFSVSDILLLLLSKGAGACKNSEDYKIFG